MGAQLLGVRYMNRTEFTRFFAEQDAIYLPIIRKLGLLVPHSK
jgi:hypothetical protein